LLTKFESLAGRVYVGEALEGMEIFGIRGEVFFSECLG